MSRPINCFFMLVLMRTLRRLTRVSASSRKSRLPPEQDRGRIHIQSDADAVDEGATAYYHRRDSSRVASHGSERQQSDDVVAATADVPPLEQLASSDTAAATASDESRSSNSSTFSVFAILMNSIID
jgi:hypothetical protein